MLDQEREQIDRMCHPRGIAIYGGVAKFGSFANSVMLAIKKYGYSGKIYPISSKEGDVLGIPLISSLDKADGPIDLASISVPAKAVPDILAQCLAHGVAGVQVHTSGFAEMGDAEGIALQKELEAYAAKGLRIVGPNCFGIHCPKGGLTMLPGFDYSKEPGPVAMISQSGGLANDFGHEACLAGLGLSKVISFGNGCDLDAISLMEYLGEDPDTQYIAAYIEGVADASAFLDVVRKTARKKPVVIWKGGLTPLGGRATLSHTGSMGGESKIWEGALAQAGAYSVQGLDEMMDTLMGLVYTKSRGKRIALVGGGGAIGVFTSDLAYRWGLEMPVFSQQTQDKLRVYFPTPGNSMKNPLDTGTPALPLDTLKGCVKEILEAEPIDVMVLMLLTHPLETVAFTFMDMYGMKAFPPGHYVESLFDTLVELKEQSGKDLALVFENRAYRLEDMEAEAAWRVLREKFQKAGIPVFASAERALRAVRNASAA
ncbi:MAG: CoA-binding protein [Desulfatibacillum sp.]|nr:CoA-binding protein [Desulfatibacillum sp.]